MFQCKGSWWNFLSSCIGKWAILAACPYISVKAVLFFGSTTTAAFHSSTKPGVKYMGACQSSSAAEGQVTPLWQGIAVRQLGKLRQSSPNRERAPHLAPSSLSHTSSCEATFCSLPFRQSLFLGSEGAYQHVAFILADLYLLMKLLLLCHLRGNKPTQNTPKTPTFPGCFSAELLKCQHRDITVVFTFLLFKDHKIQCLTGGFLPNETHFDGFYSYLI